MFTVIAVSASTACYIYIGNYVISGQYGSQPTSRVNLKCVESRILNKNGIQI